MHLETIRALLGGDAALLDAPLAPLPPLAPGLFAGPDYVDRAATQRGPAWLRSFQALFDAGRLGGSGYVALLDAEGPAEAVAALAQEGGCSGLVAPEDTLRAVARRYAHRVPLLAKVTPEADAAAQARRLRDLGAVGIALGAGDAALAEAATAEGLIVLLSDAPGFGAALACGPETASVAEARARVVAAQSIACGALVAGPLADPGRLLRAGIVGLRAGALGIVVRGAPGPSVEADVAALHAAQDVWTWGSVAPA